MLTHYLGLFIKSKRKYPFLGLIVLLVTAGLFFCACQQDDTDKQEVGIIPVSKQSLDDMIDSKETFFVYVGRPSCPDCQDFYPEFEKKITELEAQIYYFNTEVKASQRAEMKAYVQAMGVDQIPAIVDIRNGSVHEVYDGQNESDIDMFYKIIEEGQL